MELELFYDTKEAIPAGYEELYTERDGKWHLTAVKGMKTADDVAKVTTANTKLRTQLKTAEEKLKGFGEHDPAKLAEDLAELDELRAIRESGGLKDEAKIAELVETRVKAKIAPLQREFDATKTKLTEREAEVGSLQGTLRQTKIDDAVRAVALEQKVITSAVDDVLLYGGRVFEVDDEGKVVTRDGVGVTPGLGPKEWLNDMKKARPHWWPPSQGGGAPGSGGHAGLADNPWTKGNWNSTAQGAYIKAHGIEKAKAAAAAAGSSVGATRPPAA